MGFHEIETSFSSGSRALGTNPENTVPVERDDRTLPDRIIEKHINAAKTMLATASEHRTMGLNRDSSEALQRVALARTFLKKIPFDITDKDLALAIDQQPDYTDQFNGLAPEVIVVFTRIIRSIDRNKHQKAITERSKTKDDAAAPSSSLEHAA